MAIATKPAYGEARAPTEIRIAPVASMTATTRPDARAVRPTSAVPTAWPTTVTAIKTGTIVVETPWSRATSGKYSSYVVMATIAAARTSTRRTSGWWRDSARPARSIVT